MQMNYICNLNDRIDKLFSLEFEIILSHLSDFQGNYKHILNVDISLRFILKLGFQCN